jgi:hypothetical protein
MVPKAELKLELESAKTKRRENKRGDRIEWPIEAAMQRFSQRKGNWVDRRGMKRRQQRCWWVYSADPLLRGAATLADWWMRGSDPGHK